MPRKLIPKHTPALGSGDFMPYLLEPLRRRRRHPALSDVWRERLPDRALFGTPSGRHALWLYLEAANLPAGTEVPVAAYNYYVVVRLLAQKGLRPVFVDVDRETLGMDPADLRRKVSPATGLVVVTHMYGNPADITEIGAICDEHRVPLFEDCAHAVGTTVAGRHVGRFGEGALFSFGPLKSVTAFGGGMLAVAPSAAGHVRPGPPSQVSWLTRRRTFFCMLMVLLMTPPLYRWGLHPLTRVASRLADRGISRFRDIIAPSTNDAWYRFSPDSYPPFRPFVPDMLRRQLERLEDRVDRRRAVMGEVKRRLADIPAIEFLHEDKHGRANGSYFGVYVPDPEAFRRHMLDHGVEITPHPFYDCSQLAQFGDYADHCANAAHAASHFVRLPSYSSLRAADVDRIVAATTAYFAAGRGGTPRPPAVTRASARAA